jgi:hypothetical protein
VDETINGRSHIAARTSESWDKRDESTVSVARSRDTRTGNTGNEGDSTTRSRLSGIHNTRLTVTTGTTDDVDLGTGTRISSREGGGCCSNTIGASTTRNSDLTAIFGVGIDEASFTSTTETTRDGDRTTCGSQSVVTARGPGFTSTTSTRYKGEGATQSSVGALSRSSVGRTSTTRTERHSGVTTDTGINRAGLSRTVCTRASVEGESTAHTAASRSVGRSSIEIQATTTAANEGRNSGRDVDVSTRSSRAAPRGQRHRGVCDGRDGGLRGHAQAVGY